MRQLILPVLIVVVILVTVFLPSRGTHRAVQAEICGLVSEKFFRNDKDLADWVRNCQADRSRIGLFWTRERFMQEVQVLLDQLAVSHLMIYNPVEDRRLWRGEAVDTGIRARLIEGRLVVDRVLKQSPAALADIQSGDELLSINQEPTRSVWSAQTREGLYEFQRREKILQVFLTPKTLVIDQGPNLKPLNQQTAQLEISSFRAEYFEAEAWRKLVQQLSSYKKVIVDLRQNSGGNLVAMLRALSPFFCETQTVGFLSQPRREQAVGPAPQDNLDEMQQLAWLEKYRKVPLKTYSTYGCVKMPVTVLIDSGSASVSEIFAQAMLVRPQTRVWGQPSAGDVVLATWYGLPLLGPGYSLSIPEALYLTLSGDSLEGSGVWPQKELSYDLKEALSGQDSWLLRAQAQ